MTSNSLINSSLEQTLKISFPDVDFGYCQPLFFFRHHELLIYLRYCHKSELNIPLPPYLFLSLFSSNLHLLKIYYPFPLILPTFYFQKDYKFCSAKRQATNSAFLACLSDLHISRHRRELWRKCKPMEENKWFTADFNVVKISVIYPKQTCSLPFYFFKWHFFLGVDNLRLTMLASESSFYHDTLKKL